MTPLGSQVLEALRHYAVAYQESAHHLARWMGLPSVDGNALGEIVWADREGAPLSPARLSVRIGLTSGATNALLNRLEARGLVGRTRESLDRRIVTVRPTAAALHRLDPFLSRAGGELGTALDDYDDEALATILGFLTRMVAILPAEPPSGTDASNPAREG